MPEIHVLVATTSTDLAAEVIAAAVARCADMRLVGEPVVSTTEIEELLAEVPPSVACALVLVGRASDTASLQTRWIGRRKRLVVLRIDILEDLVHVAARQVGMDALLAAVRDLVHHVAVLPACWRQRIHDIDAVRAACCAVMRVSNAPLVHALRFCAALKVAQATARWRP